MRMKGPEGAKAEAKEAKQETAGVPASPQMRVSRAIHMNPMRKGVHPDTKSVMQPVAVMPLESLPSASEDSKND